LVLAHLRRQWSLSGRDWRDSALFVEVKHLFSTTLVAEIFSKPSWIETEVNGGHWGDRMLDRTLDRTRSRYDRMRPVSGRAGRGVCGQFEWHVRSIVGPMHTVRRPEGQQIARSIGRGACLVTIDRTRPVTSGCLLETTGRWHCGVQLMFHVRGWCANCASSLCHWRVRLRLTVGALSQPLRSGGHS
jgi:hypothetical protein